MINNKNFDAQIMKPCRELYAAGLAWYNTNPGTEGGKNRMAQQRWSVAGCVLWIAGLIAFIIGLNLNGAVKDWMTVTGSIAFLLGLGITGALWMKRNKDENG